MDQAMWIVIPAALAGLAAAFYFGARSMRTARRQRTLRESREAFCLRREWLEVDFLEMASRSGKPRGLIWTDCDFDDDVAFARDRRNGELRALVGVTIRFEAIAGGDMEEVEAVGNQRAATAVFRYEGRSWRTDGRAVFNLDPIQTIQHFQHELERISG